MKVKVCLGSRCMLFGALRILEQLEGLQELREENPDKFTDEELLIEEVPCLGYCKETEDKISPIVKIEDEIFYRATSQEIMERVMSRLSTEYEGD